MTTRLKNHLNHQVSPHLAGHSTDPIDWYPWCPDALQLARELNRPIFLSIGYSACHWCHVMAEESFQDIETANLLNQYFLCIKVDAQERPDIDKVYQTAYQLMHHEIGGWPLNAILTPNQHIPFLVGTYFPKESLQGQPSFKDIVRSSANYYQQHHKTIEQNHSPLAAALNGLCDIPKQPLRDSMNEKPLTMARIAWEEDYDEVHGGFGKSPKFPHISFLEGLLRYWHMSLTQQEEDKAALRMLINSLSQMAKSGLVDHLGGGFFRYAIDAAWHIPHFEKMLYDNAQLMTLYTQLYLCAPEPLFQKTVEGIVTWVLQDCHSPEGGFYACMDSDSQGKEGAYYIWDAKAVETLLGKDTFRGVADYWGLSQPSNFYSAWHLRICDEENKRPSEEIIQSAKHTLCTIRDARQKPHRDEKILVSWNALTIKGLCVAYHVFQKPEWKTAAEKAIDLIYGKMWFSGKLYTSYKEGICSTQAYLDDYAFLLDALLTYLQIEWKSQYLEWAIQLANQLIFLFEDEKRGGFFFTANDQESLLFRPKPLPDEAVPSGNGIAAQSLLILGYLLGEVRYLTAAERTLRMADRVLHQHSIAHQSLLAALQYYLQPPPLIVLVGKEAPLKEWKSAIPLTYNPTRFVFAIPEHDLPPKLHDKKPRGVDIAAYVCQGIQCQAPIVNKADFLAKFF